MAAATGALEKVIMALRGKVAKLEQDIRRKQKKKNAEEKNTYPAVLGGSTFLRRPVPAPAPVPASPRFFLAARSAAGVLLTIRPRLGGGGGASASSSSSAPPTRKGGLLTFASSAKGLDSGLSGSPG